MRRTLLLASVIALGVGAAFAQSGPIDQRKAEMKAMGGAAGAMGKMLKGEEAFDLAKVKTGLETIAKNAKSGPALYPAGSGAGDTKAQAAIWTDKAKFDGLFAKLGTVHRWWPAGERHRCRRRFCRNQGRSDFQGRSRQGAWQLRRLPQGISRAVSAEFYRNVRMRV